MTRLTARTLQLYSYSGWRGDAQPCGGSGKAVREINRALTQARRALRAAKPTTVADAAAVIGQVYRTTVYPVLKANARTGACDTEPRGVVVQALVDTAKAMLGLDGYHPELGDAI